MLCGIERHRQYEAIVILAQAGIHKLSHARLILEVGQYGSRLRGSDDTCPEHAPGQDLSPQRTPESMERAHLPAYVP